jgi:transcription antitermination protein NusB
VPSRRKTREFVLQVLFAADSRDQNPLEVLAFLQDHFETSNDQEMRVDRVEKDYAYALVNAVSSERDTIDLLISRLSHHWKIHRMTRVDRNILRMAIAEITSLHEAPTRVILNEAIEISKKYGAENSGSFINGILDKIHSLEPRPASASHLFDVMSQLD